MDRMTFKNGDDVWCVDNDDCFEEQSEHYCGPAIDRLARYENLEKSGRLVVLPCKAGDEVYIPGHRLAAQIDEITIDATNGVVLNWSEYEAGPELTELWDDGWFTPEDFGKTVFLTREEAEKALEETK